MEARVLAALCQSVGRARLLDTAKPLLRDYRWLEPIHAAIFQALAKLPPQDPAALRELLPARLTRLGFPDVNWEEFFDAAPPSSEEAERMISVLEGKF